MPKNVVGTFLETLLVPGTQECVQQDVIGFESGIGDQFAGPVTLLMLARKKILSSRID